MRFLELMHSKMLNKTVELTRKREAYAIATVVNTRGSSSAKPGSKAIISGKGLLLEGWVGGGCAEAIICSTALECLDSGDSQLINIDLNDEVLGAGMPCGGDMDVFIEPVLPAPSLWVIGHGRIAECLCLIADMLELNVVLITHGFEPKNLPPAVTVIADDVDLHKLHPTENDFVVIATQHKGDHKALAHVLNSPAAYIALIASKKRAGLVMEYLREENFSVAALQRVVTPAGLDLGAQTPAEIALAICSEIVLYRRIKLKLDSTQPQTEAIKRANNL